MPAFPSKREDRRNRCNSKQTGGGVNLGDRGNRSVVDVRRCPAAVQPIPPRHSITHLLTQIAELRRSGEHTDKKQRHFCHPKGRIPRNSKVNRRRGSATVLRPETVPFREPKIRAYERAKTRQDVAAIRGDSACKSKRCEASKGPLPVWLLVLTTPATPPIRPPIPCRWSFLRQGFERTKWS